jgi:hypothetical protein
MITSATSCLWSVTRGCRQNFERLTAIIARLEMHIEQLTIHVDELNSHTCINEVATEKARIWSRATNLSDY